MVRSLGFTAVRALDMPNRLQGIMRPAHIAAGFGSFLLRNGHFSVLTVDWMAKREPF